MNSQSVKKSGIIFIGTLAVFIAIALGTLVTSNNNNEAMEANYEQIEPRMAPQDSVTEKPVRQARLNVIDETVER